MTNLKIHTVNLMNYTVIESEHNVTILTEENENLQLKLLELEAKITVLKNKITLLKDQSVQDKLHFKVYENILTRGQITYLNLVKCLNWNSEDIACLLYTSRCV